MTIPGRFGGWLLLLFGAGLTVFGLVDARDVVVLAGAFVVTAAIALERVRPARRGPRRESPVAAAKAEMRRDIEERVAEQIRRARNN